MNILVIAPHPDDETIGCGGTLCLHAKRGDRTVVVCVTSGELGLKHLPREKAWAIREKEAETAATILGVTKVHFLRQPDWMLENHLDTAAKMVRPILRAENPGVIYLPHNTDGHPDHRACQPILRLALAEARQAKAELRAYEVWTPLAGYDRLEDITGVMPRKLQALRAHESQLGEFNYERAVCGLNAFRGELAAKCEYAEVFQTVTWEAHS
jgi:N-acetylglucosamine malate deacetylase 1